MRVAVGSGKGGTGKTTFSVAFALANSDRARLVDCDVEEPNAHLFLPGEQVLARDVFASIPVIDPDACDRCGLCVQFCNYNALALAGKGGPLVFAELCHDCGGCARVCPKGAITEKPVKRGTIETRHTTSGLELVTGRLEVGSPSAPTVIHAAIASTPASDVATTILDAPPGTACSFAACAEESDYCLFVTDPTPFGLHDLDLAVQAARDLRKPFSVIVNRSQGDDDAAARHCRERGYRIDLRIPEDRAIAETYSRSGTLLDIRPDMAAPLRALLERLATGGEA